MITLDDRKAMRLTDHFTREDFLRSDSAVRLGIDNTPPAEIEPRLLTLAYAAESIRAAAGAQPTYISSGYRCPDLNAFVGGAMTQESLRIVIGTSRIDEVVAVAQARLNRGRYDEHDSGHMACWCLDMTCPPHTPVELIGIVRYAGIPFDQLIQEGTWMHWSGDPRARGIVLTAHFGDVKTVYTWGS